MPLLGSAYVVCCSLCSSTLSNNTWLPSHQPSPAQHTSPYLLTYPAAAAVAAHPHHIYHITSHSITHRIQHIITTPDTSHLTHASYLTYTSLFVRHYREFLAVSACGLVINFLSYFVIQITSSLTLKGGSHPTHPLNALCYEYFDIQCFSSSHRLLICSSIVCSWLTISHRCV